MLKVRQFRTTVSSDAGKLTRLTSRSALSRFHLAITLAFVLSMGAIFPSASNAASIRFSEAQIRSYVKIVTAEIELTNNRGANFGASASNKLSCNPTVFGQGIRSGNQGLYVWVTCNAMRKLDLTSLKNSSNSCSGFSVPVWIEANATSVSYRAISSGPEYIAFRSSAPSDVQAALDATYNQIYASGRQTPSPASIKNKTAGSFAGLSSCK